MTNIRNRKRSPPFRKGTHPGMQPFPSEEEIEKVAEEHGRTSWELAQELENTFPIEAREAAIHEVAKAMGEGADGPAVTVRMAYNLHSTQYSQEYALRMLHRLLLRNVTAEKIAETFNVSVMTIYRWKNRLKEALSREAARIEANPLIGEGMAFFNEVRGLALQEASKGTSAEKMRALEIALKAERDKHAMLNMWGVPLSKPFTPETSGYKPGEDATDIMNAITSVIEGNEDKIIEGEYRKSKEENYKVLD